MDQPVFWRGLRPILRQHCEKPFNRGSSLFFLKSKSILTTSIMLLCMQICVAQADETDPQADTVETKVKKYKPKISGFVQTLFLHQFETNGDGETEPDRFRIQRVRIKVSGKVTKDISYQVEIDPRAPQVTGFLRDAYISLGYIKNQEIRIGQQKTQFGYENTISSSRLYFVNRTDVSDNLTRGINLRDIGVGLVGQIPINKKFKLENAITLVNGAGMNVQADNNKKKNIWGRVGIWYKPNEDFRLRFGISGAKADIMEEEIDSLGVATPYPIDFTRLGIDILIEKNWFTLIAEYVRGEDQEPEELVDRNGYYVMLMAKTSKQIGPTLRYENLDDSEFSRWTIGAYYGKPSAPFRILVNYEIRKLEEDPEQPFGEDNRFYIWFQVRF